MERVTRKARAGPAVAVALAGLALHGCGGPGPTQGELSEEARAAVMKKRVDVQDRAASKAGRRGSPGASKGASH
ncbi:hypothetical protein OJF2_25910 [Aquisphaera giovannonii]|uniref:Lipoprotein n=2 Tax=Aquisphaera giovannonii TaxID=406548 RepID=A0A5B9W0H2_9BACT|nr:hypothetical protein OJF2_25910 [Aquisphaera giovannonii]